MIYGAPRSGKTTLSNLIIQKWNSDEIGKNNTLKRLGTDEYSNYYRIKTCTKLINDRISVIIDGNCHTEIQRSPFLEIAKQTNTPVIYVENNPGLLMSYIFNHVSVEMAKDENICLYNDKEYHYYKSVVKRPDSVLSYCPIIDQKKEVMLYRY